MYSSFFFSYKIQCGQFKNWCVQRWVSVIISDSHGSVGGDSAAAVKISSLMCFEYCTLARGKIMKNFSINEWKRKKRSHTSHCFFLYASSPSGNVTMYNNNNNRFRYSDIALLSYCTSLSDWWTISNYDFCVTTPLMIIMVTL